MLRGYDESFPQLFRIKLEKSLIIIGEAIKNTKHDSDFVYVAYLQANEGVIITNAKNIKKLKKKSHELCYMKLLVKIHDFRGESLQLLKTDLFIN